MYTEYFNLRIKPFEMVPNPEFLYQSRSHKKALNYLRYGLLEKAGFILLTGEVGSGKTTIVRNIIKSMEKDVALSMLFNTKVSNKQVLAMINEDFGLNVNGKDKIALLRNLNDFLVGMHAQNRHAVVIIDEAQNLSPSALEEIRLLSNLEATDSKLLQIVLVGQPELLKTIADHELRQLRQRISVHCQIDPLSRLETEEYVYHRLEKAGNRDALEWCEGTFDVLFNYSNGIPRLVNVFCDFILLAAYVEKRTEVTVEFTEDVIADVSWEQHLSGRDETHEIDNIPHKNIAERLSVFEQKMAVLESLLQTLNEVNLELAAQKALLDDIFNLQKGGFQRMEKDLERTCHHLEMYLTGVAAKDDTDLNLDELEELNANSGKGLLKKLFS